MSEVDELIEWLATVGEVTKVITPVASIKYTFRSNGGSYFMERPVHYEESLHDVLKAIEDRIRKRLWETCNGFDHK